MLQALHGSYPLLFYCLPVGGVALAVVGLLVESVRSVRWLRFLPLLVLPILALAVVGLDLGEPAGSWPAVGLLALVCGLCYGVRAPVLSRGVSAAWATVGNARFQWTCLLVASISSGTM